MKKILIASLIATLALSACNKQDAPPADTTPQSTTAPSDNPPPEHDHNHEHGEHHDHDHHDHHDEHEGHAHHHDDGKNYQCGDKTVNIVIHDHEGETEAHATIDDVEYDLNPDDDGNANVFISHEESIKGKGMKMVKEGDNFTFKSLDDKEVLLSCVPKTA